MSTEQKPNHGRKVEVTEDGPYVVTGAIPLSKLIIATDAEGGSESWQQGKVYGVEETYSLCRCGHSQTKPFCDASHLKHHFDGSETASREPYMDQAEAMQGPEFALTDVQGLCAFARFCDPHGQVWAQVKRTGNPKVREQFLRQVGQCPSGRLIAWDKKTQKPIEPELPVSIGLIEDPSQGCSGPLWLRGGVQVVAADGFKYEVRNRVTLCRCGQSQNKPFCDGTHAAIKFRDE
ncbi:MAG TPA: CDGSH iron-sulfur domain-containing protein [Gammaproteobacteria bacterium]|nr:CDGSH iron-sulfur domain-containing protein [Gammaproteobacteria bacterium]